MKVAIFKSDVSEPLPRRKRKNSFASCKISDQKRRWRDVQPKLIFSLCSWCKLLQESSLWGCGGSFYASVFCSVECVEPGKFSSHTTP